MGSHPDNAQALAKTPQSNTLDVDIPEYQSRRSGNTKSPTLMTLAQELRDLVYDFAIRDSGKAKITIDDVDLKIGSVEPFNVTTYIALQGALPPSRRHELPTRMPKADAALFLSVAQLVLWLPKHFDKSVLASIRTIVLNEDWMILSNSAFANLPNLKTVFLGPGPYTSRLSRLSGWQSGMELYYGDGPPPLIDVLLHQHWYPAPMNTTMAPQLNLVQALIEDTQRSIVVPRSALPKDQDRNPPTTSSPGFLSLPQELRDLIYDLALQGPGQGIRRFLAHEAVLDACPSSQPVNLATFKAIYDIFSAGCGLGSRLFTPHDALFTTIAELRWLLENVSTPTLDSIRTIVVDVDHTVSSAADYFALNVDANFSNLEVEYIGHGYSYTEGRIYLGRQTMIYHTYVPRSIWQNVREPPDLSQLTLDERLRELREYDDRWQAAFAAPAEEKRALQDLSACTLRGFGEV
ncbi:hypothetical protein LTR56_010514 [Elasticomyces elasticus]|nr:hypothetical protein LTR56_010514 [Elasticomyces elasticus]KAK3657930.1 hypothetical protein LTR22_009157 [Elasticomyces elasticus]KAK4917617.1 hypothetical protein LTR49_014571 [Elasticomyces elasticus]KAK5762837.1 hypothetical protein LTS12_007026 [Elasticomyces elasticus]